MKTKLILTLTLALSGSLAANIPVTIEEINNLVDSTNSKIDSESNQSLREKNLKNEAISNSEIKQSLIDQSRGSYHGSCPCPYDLDRAGRRCGRRSAYNRPGGHSPLCYEHDISSEMLKKEKMAINEAFNSIDVASDDLKEDKELKLPSKSKTNNNSDDSINTKIDSELNESLREKNPVIINNISVSPKINFNSQRIDKEDKVQQVKQPIDITIEDITDTRLKKEFTIEEERYISTLRKEYSKGEISRENLKIKHISSDEIDNEIKRLNNLMKEKTDIALKNRLIREIRLLESVKRQ